MEASPPPPSIPMAANPVDGHSQDVFEATPSAGPSTAAVSSAPRRQYTKKVKKIDQLTSATLAFVPGLYHIKNPAGDFVQREYNIEVARQRSLLKLKNQEDRRMEEISRCLAEGRDIPQEPDRLSHILVIHPGSRHLRIGRASDFYPHEIPNCIARPANAPNRGCDPPVPGSRMKRVAEEVLAQTEGKKLKEEGINTNANGNERGHEDAPWVDPVDRKIGSLRDYLRNRLRQNKLTTDYTQAGRVVLSNSKAKPENLPEHNDPYRIDWTEADNRPFFIGRDALRLPESARYKVRYPILSRNLNKRDWRSSQMLMDDIAVILQESLKKELGISRRDHHKYSVLLIVPDHGDRFYVQEMTNLILGEMGFLQISVQQEAYCAIFSAGMSSACVVDIGASQISVTCVDEGVVNADTRINLAYGGDDITTTLTTMLQRSAFPYRELNLARSQDWLMMDNLKIKICTLEEHMVANTPWDFFVLRTEGLTQKYPLRTYDENILAPLCFFDTRMIDFEEKLGDGQFEFWGTGEHVTDMMTSHYTEATGAMKACTVHLVAALPTQAAMEETPIPEGSTSETSQSVNGDVTTNLLSMPASSVAPSETSALNASAVISESVTPTPMETVSNPVENVPLLSSSEIVREASRSPLDAAIAASISMCGTENKIKTAASSILLVGGSSAIKGLSAFLAERIPPLLRAKNFPISDVGIVPPPRNLNPRFVSWRGASVMCNLESLADMWIRADEFEGVGARSLKDRCPFL
ncbi:actin-related protein 8, partial [Tremellales sp. Uapishka_1]